jgi:hypothetical protein
MSNSWRGLHRECTREAHLNMKLGIFALFTTAAGILAYRALTGIVSFGGMLAYGPVAQFVNVQTDTEYYSHILLIPFVSAYFLFVDRGDIFRRTSYWLWGLGVAGCGVLTYGAARISEGTLMTTVTYSACAKAFS